MKDVKDVLLFLQSFDENNMFDFEHKNKLDFLTEVLRSVMYRRNKKNDLSFCENGILDLIDLTLKISDMVLLKMSGILQEIKKLCDGMLLYGYAYKSLFEYDVLSENSDTREIIGFRNV